jgi:hypothetical protein
LAKPFTSFLVAPLQRNDDVKPLAAGGLGEACQPQRPKPVPDLQRCRHHVAEPQPLSRIEIEDRAVRALRPVDAHAPGMHLQHAHLHQRNEPFCIVDVKISP